MSAAFISHLDLSNMCGKWRSVTAVAAHVLGRRRIIAGPCNGLYSHQNLSRSAARSIRIGSASPLAAVAFSELQERPSTSFLTSLPYSTAQTLAKKHPSQTPPQPHFLLNVTTNWYQQETITSSATTFYYLSIPRHASPIYRPVQALQSPTTHGWRFHHRCSIEPLPQ